MQACGERKVRQAEIVLLIVVVIVGINTPVMKIGLMAVSPLIYNTFRLVLAALLSSAAMLLTKTYKAMPVKDIKQIVAISFLGFFFNQVFIIFGIPQTTAGNASLVLATLPVEIALINRMLKIEPISGRMAAGIVTGLVGVFLIVLGSDKELSLSGPHVIGAALILTGQFCYGYFTVLSKQLINEYSLYQIIACVMSINAVLFCLSASPELAQISWGSIPAAAWYSIIFSATFAMSLANFAWIWAVGVLGSTRASLYQYLCPVVAIAFAWVYLDETFGFFQCIGAAVTFLGLYLTRNHTRRQPASGSSAQNLSR